MEVTEHYIHKYRFWTEKKPRKICFQKRRKILTSEEVLKDIQNLLDKEDNENISDEVFNLDELYGEKSIFVSFYQYINVKLLVDFCIHSFMSFDVIM